MRNVRNSSPLISPEAIANSRWRPRVLAVPADRDIVGRIEKGSVDLHAFPDDAPQERAVATVPAAKAMVAEDPDVIRSGSRRRFYLREMIVVRIVRTQKDDIDLPLPRSP